MAPVESKGVDVEIRAKGAEKCDGFVGLVYGDAVLGDDLGV